MSNKLFRCFKIDEQKRLGAAIAKEFIVCPVGKKIDHISLKVTIFAKWDGPTARASKPRPTSQKGYLVIFPYPSAPPRTKTWGRCFSLRKGFQRWRRQC